MKMRRFILFLLVLAGWNDAMAQTIMNIHLNNQPVMQIPITDIDSITYSAVGDPGALPLVVTIPMSVFTATTATLGGTVDVNGGTTITDRGIAWSALPSPTTADSFLVEGNGSGTFSLVIPGLETGVTYYARAFATNSAGTAYGNEVEFFTTIDYFVPGDGVTDGDGNFYETQLMGNGQEWMKENLYTTKYANGDPIPNVQDAGDWSNLTSGAWASYNNNPNNEIPMRKLYNWYAVSDPRNACPAGWHVPTDEEWTSLTVYLGGLSFAGGKLKDTGTDYWLSPNTGATNESGLTFYPGGTRTGAGIFQEIYGTGMWWSSTPNNSFSAWMRTCYYTANGAYRGTAGILEGASVRCIKD